MTNAATITSAADFGINTESVDTVEEVEEEEVVETEDVELVEEETESFDL